MMMTSPEDIAYDFLDRYMYNLFLDHSPNLTLKEVSEIMKNDSMIVDEKDLIGSYEMNKDLYKENEEDGWHDEVYPNRVKEKDMRK